MIEKEITQAKQCALTTRDWDTYQVILRICLDPAKSFRSHQSAQSQPDRMVLTDREADRKKQV